MQTSDSFVCRNVIREHAFDAAAATIFGDVKRADEALSGIDFTLARAPVSYSTLAGTFGAARVFTIKTRPTHQWPAVTVFYSCSDTVVTYLSIEISDDDEEL